MSAVLLVGSTGVLGSSFEEDYFRPSKEEFDILDPVGMATYVTANKVSVIINCVALVGTGVCDADVQKAYDLNVKGVQNLVSLCKEHGIRLIHFSTIYSGSENLYSWTKLLSESIVLDNLKDSVVIRLPWLFGGARSTTFIHVIQDHIASGESLGLYDDPGFAAYTKDITHHVEHNLCSMFGLLDMYSQDCLVKKDLVDEVAALLGTSCKTHHKDRPIPMKPHLGARRLLLRSWKESLKEYFNDIGALQSTGKDSVAPGQS